ncbi:MAG: glycine cleavage system aminomethyltransferase GcvT [Azospirillaceae bacterium]
MTQATDTLQTTPLNGLHRELGARLVPFAGYEMPVQYPAGILQEHTHTRTAAGLFDVSHMGQAELVGAGAIAAAEALVPGDIAGLAPGRMRYTVLTTDEGGIVDDLMVTRPAEDGAEDGEERLLLVVNAARKGVDFKHIEDRLPAGVRLVVRDDLALLALQGPKAAAVMGRLCPEVVDLRFMSAERLPVDGHPATVFRSGYTGEDGFEISVSAEAAETLARRLLAEEEVAPIGLGARDSLRLEAGLCLYGHDIDETTSPVEASLSWIIGKRRRTEGGFPGADRILRELAEGPARKRVGLTLEGRAPAREGSVLTTPDGDEVGVVTSGGFAPTVGAPIAMGYVTPAVAAAGTELAALVRGRSLAGRVADLPFVKRRS